MASVLNNNISFFEKSVAACPHQTEIHKEKKLPRSHGTSSGVRKGSPNVRGKTPT